MDFKLKVSKHAEKRLKERLGLNRSASRRHAEKAFHEGIPPDRYPNKTVADWFSCMQRMEENAIRYIMYQDRVYIFALDHFGNTVLITVYSPQFDREEDEYPVYIKGRLRY